MRENSEKVDMYDFPVHDYTQEQNGSPYFSSIVQQWKWPSLSRKIVVIQKFCYHMVTWCHNSSLYIVSVTTMIADKRLEISTIVRIAVIISESSLEPKPLSVVSCNDHHDCYDGGS